MERLGWDCFRRAAGFAPEEGWTGGGVESSLACGENTKEAFQVTALMKGEVNSGDRLVAHACKLSTQIMYT